MLLILSLYFFWMFLTRLCNLFFELIVSLRNLTIIDINLNFIQFYRSLIKLKSFHHEKLTTILMRIFAKQIENNFSIIELSSVNHRKSTSFQIEAIIDQDEHFSLETIKSNVERSWSEYSIDYFDRVNSTMREQLKSSTKLALNFKDIEMNAHNKSTSSLIK